MKASTELGEGYMKVKNIGCEQSFRKMKEADSESPNSRAERRQEFNCCKPSYPLCPTNARAF